MSTWNSNPDANDDLGMVGEEIAKCMRAVYERNTRASFIREALQRELNRWDEIMRTNQGERPHDAEYVPEVNLNWRCKCCDGLGFVGQKKRDEQRRAAPEDDTPEDAS
jgi:hypothetical protein